MGEPRSAAAGRIARNQHGLITRRQARAIGYPPSAIQQERAKGRWVTIERGVYLLNGAPQTWSTEMLAGCLAYDGLASHRACARLLGVDCLADAAVEMSVERGRRTLRCGGTVHERLDLALARRTARLIDGIPTTSPARLVADLGTVVPYATFESIVEDLIRRRLLTWQAARSSMNDHAGRGRDGVGVLRSLLEERYLDDVGDSVLEDSFAREGRRRGLPAPTPQFQIYDALGFIARVDYAYPRHLVAIELDSVQHHLTRRAFEEDRRKRNRLKLAGWLVLEFTRRMLRNDPATVFRQVELALAHRAA